MNLKLPPLLLQKTVEVRSALGETAYGKTLGDPVEVKARVNYRRRLVKSAQGEDLMAEATLLTDADAPIDVGSSVTFDGTTYSAVQVLKPEHLNGQPLYREVLLAP